MGNTYRSSFDSGSETDETDHRLPDELLDDDQQEITDVEAPEEEEGGVDQEFSPAERQNHQHGGGGSPTGAVGHGASIDVDTEESGTEVEEDHLEEVDEENANENTEEEELPDAGKNESGLLSPVIEGVLELARGQTTLDTSGRGIPGSKLKSWSKSGPRRTPKETCDRLRRTLNTSEELTERAGVEYRVYLQGSYKNHTNIHGDSDVDIVIQLTSPYRADSDRWLANGDNIAKNGSRVEYGFEDFKADVVAALRKRYGHDAVTVDDKAIKLHARDSTLRIDADIVVSQRYRPDNGPEAMWFRSSSNRAVVNYPERHYRNGAEKNRETDGRYRETVRMFKRARTYLIKKGRISKDNVPSYFLECLLYNVPNKAYTENHQERYVSIVNHLNNNKINLQQFTCQNGQQDLFGSQSTQWDERKAKRFIRELIRLYQNWYDY
ncbi:nucleotidyltransferase domain-containing protein [Halomarina pelagica]|uniref:nucleotidyltransferase domain-containing protein n=1 Tax=Halomarina pelagica TaxID=2961599 RepID=UPI0020C25A94|nr:nucleotidyltransferase [Halomarina sp. BND7]